MKKFNAFVSVFLFFVFISLFCSVALAEGEIPAASITVETSEGVQTVTPGNTLNMIARILPEDATDKSVTWSVGGTGSASITADGILSGEQTGTVTVRATANDGSNVYGECQIEIVNFLGEGTQSNPYRIDSAQDISRLASLVNAGNSPYSDKHYIQTQDINLAQFSNWIPIGSYLNSDSSYLFYGTYNGNGKTVKNMNIEINANIDVYAGLFGGINGTVENLKLENTNIVIKTSGIAYAGGIAGYMQYGRIENCQNGGTFSLKADTGNFAYAGGIAGRVFHSCNVRKCNFSGSIISSAEYAYAGGIIGYSSNDICIRDCVCSGNIRAEGCSAYAGGITGYINISETQNIITGCYNTANVSHYTASSSYSASAGIVAFLSTAIISDCFNSGKISADISCNNNAGGIAGENNNYLCSINNCYNTGVVTGALWCGGIVAHMRGTAESINNCYYLDNAQSGVGQGVGTAYKKTWDELTKQDTFQGFDFVNIWAMDTDIQAQTHYKLPQLKTNLYYPPYNAVSLSLNIEGLGTTGGSGSYALGEPVTITAIPDTDYRFIRWEVKSGNLTLANTTDFSVSFIMPAGVVEIMAIFDKDQYGVAIENDGNGTAIGGGLHGWGDAVQISAQPAMGYRFSHWEVVFGDIAIEGYTNAQSSFIMPKEEVIIKAHFTKIQYALTIAGGGNGLATGGGIYNWGEEVNISAAPEEGYHFKNWEVILENITLPDTSAANVAFIMPQGDVALKAYFEKDQYGVAIENDGNGTAIGGGLHGWGDAVQISARPAMGYRFSHWEVVFGDIAIEGYANAQSSFIMPKEEVIIKAHFAKIQYAVVIAGEGNGLVTGGGMYNWGEEVNISAAPEEGYHFKNWEVKSGNITLSSTTEFSVSFIMPVETVEITAVFEKDQYNMKIENALTGVVQEETHYWGETVQVNSEPPDYYCFSHWEVVFGDITINNPFSAQNYFTMPKSDVVIKAYVDKEKYRVWMAENENGALYGSGNYAWDTIVYISAVPDPGYCFKGWKIPTGQKVLANASIMETEFFMPKSDILFQAVFEKMHCTVILKSDGNGTEKGSGTYDWGSKVSLTARPKDGFRFICWKKDGLILSYDSDYIYTIKSSDTIQAVYELIGAPVLNTVESAGFDSIRVSWEPVADASGYVVFCATSAMGIYREIDDVADKTEYVMNGLAMAKQYFFRVKAYCKTGNTTTYGSLSSYKFASPMPAIPPAFGAVASGKKIKLSWGKVEKATKYELYRATSPNGKYKRLANTCKTNYTDKMLKGKTYYYKVRSYYKKNRKVSYYSGFAYFIVQP